MVCKIKNIDRLIRPLLVALLLLGVPVSLLADISDESIGDGLVCISVFPCDEKGYLKEEFNVGPCAVLFAQQCADLRARICERKLSAFQRQSEDSSLKIRKARRIMARAANHLKNKRPQKALSALRERL